MKDESDREPDCLLVDIELPGVCGLDLIRRLRDQQSGIVCVVVTSSTKPSDIVEAMKCGASGYVCKQAGAEELMACLASLVADGVMLSPAAAALLVDEFSKSGKPTQGENLRRLTRRETEVLQVLSSKGNAKDTAATLGLSHETVRVHMKKIYQKLHVASKAEAVAIYAQSKISLDVNSAGDSQD